jgi:hypothetical protein
MVYLPQARVAPPSRDSREKQCLLLWANPRGSNDKFL